MNFCQHNHHFMQIKKKKKTGGENFQNKIQEVNVTNCQTTSLLEILLLVNDLIGELLLILYQ